MKQRYRNWRTSWYLPRNKMDDLKKQDVQIKDICLYGMYISEMEDQDPEKSRNS